MLTLKFTMTPNMKPVVAVFVALMLCTQASAQAMFRGDAAHSGVAQSSAPRQLPRVKWSFPTGGRIVSSAVFGDGVVFVGSDDGNVYALAADNGQQRWMFRTGGPVAATPALANGHVYIGSYDGKFYALDAKNGAMRWKFATGGERRFEARGLHGMQPRQQTIADPFDVFLSSPVLAQGAVYFGSGDGHLYALDAHSGELRWKFKTDDVVHASPAYADGVVFVGSWDSRLYAVDATSGKELWRYQAGQDALMHNQVGFQSSPAVADGVVYVGGRDSKLHAVDARTGKALWTFSTGVSWVVSSPAVSRGRVIFGTSDSSLLHMLDAKTGAMLVQQQDKAYMFSSPTVAGDVLLIGVINGSLQARDLHSGAPLWTWRTEASLANAGWALTAEGRLNSALVYPSPWHDVTVVGAARQDSVGSIYATPLVVGGVIYIGSADGRLYALE
jgi:eukaryotic-like serine/threonine-protein kinase